MRLLLFVLASLMQVPPAASRVLVLPTCSSVRQRLSGAVPFLPASVQRPKPPPLRSRLKRLAYLLLHTTVSRGEVVYPRVAVFMIGLPGAGKSRVINSRYVTGRRPSSVEVLDLDAEIAEHPEFDLDDPDRLYLDHSLQAYSWADARVEERFSAAIANSSVKRLVIDGTGTNFARRTRRMNEAREAGMFVKALYIRVPCRTAIARASIRRRPVSAARIREYHAKMRDAVKCARESADEVEIVDVSHHARITHL